MLYDNIERSKDLSFSGGKIAILRVVKLTHNLEINNQTIVFIHPPKTAGTNIANLIKAISLHSGIIEVRAAVPRAEGVSPNLFMEGSLGGIQAIINDPEKFDCIRRDIKFISGHMPIPKTINEISYFKTKNITYISTMRDPIERELSAANFDFQRKYLEAQDLNSYLLNKTIDNLQTRLFAGEEHMIGKCTDDTLALAQKNIQERFIFVAPSEDVEIVMAILANHFRINDIAYAKAQITGIKIASRENQNLCNQLKEKHHYDLKLYEWVKIQWNTWKTNYIESISENLDDSKDYLVLDQYFPQTKIPQVMKLSEIYQISSNVEMIALLQKHGGVDKSPASVTITDVSNAVANDHQIDQASIGTIGNTTDTHQDL